MNIPETVNVSERIDRSPVRGFHRLLIFLCGLCLIVDGFDVQAMSYVAPTLVKEWGIERVALGPVFGVSLVGMFLGSVLFSVMADRVGRRPVLILGAVVVGVFMLLTARASDVGQLMVLRFLTGLGLGAIIPNAIALAAEYMPTRSRITLTMVVAAQFILGAMLGGLLSAVLIPAYGWQSVFVVGGIVPLVLALAMFLWLPESARFLIVSGRPLHRVYGWLRAIDPGLPAGTGYRLVVGEKPEPGMPVRLLFTDGRAVPTLLLWSISFLDLLVLYFLANWLPLLVSQAGHSNVSAVLSGTALQAGGLVGALLLGVFSQRFGFARALIPAFAAGAVAVACIGQATASVPAVMALIFVAGLGVVGTQATIAVLAATYYPTALRSTGVGWTSGIGRLGSILGPVVGGLLLALKWPLENLFLAAAGPAVLMTLLTVVLKSRSKPGAGTAAMPAAG